MRVALVGCLVLVMTGSAAAATVTMTATPGVVRGGTQGAGTYDALDFYWTNAPGAEFTNYRLIANATSGNLMDPARLQDDRQTTPESGLANTNTLGAVDTFANSVMAAAAKDDGGFTTSYVFNAYSPAGTGAAPPFTQLDWDVFDTVVGDDNDLSDFPALEGGPFASGAPYHIARIVTTPGAQGTVEVLAFDTSQPGVPFVFTFGFGEVPNMPPSVDPEPADTDPPNETGRSMPLPGETNLVTTTFTATDDGQPAPPTLTFSNAVLSSFVPVKPGVVNPAFNGMVAANGDFSWSTVGFHRGTYEIDVTVSDGELSSSGGNFIVTIETVPEPATLALFGLALVGVACIRRR